MKNISSTISNLDALDHELLFLDAKYRNQFPVTSTEIDQLMHGTDTLSKFITSHGEFPKVLKIFQETKKSSVSLFETLRIIEDENLIKSWFIYTLERYMTFDYNNQKMTMSQIQQKKLMTLQKSARKKILTDAKVFLKDIMHYKSVKQNVALKGKENISIEGQVFPVEQIRGLFQRAVLSTIAAKSREKRTTQSDTIEGIEDDFYDFIDSSESSSQHISLEKKSIDTLKSQPEIIALAEKYAFFKLIQNSAAKGYVLTQTELTLISDILRDLKGGKVVLLTGDTGSGKTELARFLCREYLKNNPVFVSGSKDMDVADLTMEKVITSRSPLESTDRDSIIVDEETDPVKLLKKKAHGFISLLNHKNELQKVAKDYAGSEESKQEISDFFNAFELGKSSLVTEYHLMAIYKAAELGRPVIIDEVNLIRPEIFMALNDILTRRVGDAIQLPNALGSLTVKPGFCIIMTGNDPDQNSKKKRYTLGRYAIDEASYNRLRVYAKGYATQKENLFTENKVINDDADRTEQYLADNELYGILLQLMLQKDGNLMKAGKYGFEIMKRDLDGKSLDREGVFASLKNLAHAISTIQNAYAGNRETLTNPQFKTLSLSTSINRKVFSMRNLLEVYASYKTDVRPMEYHLYSQYINLTTPPEERYALLAIFSEYGFFTDLITDDIDKSIQNAKTLFKKMETMQYNTTDIENKIIITKQDIYREYFGSFDFSDSVFHGVDLQIPEPEGDETPADILDSTNIVTAEDIATYCDTLGAEIENHLDIFSTDYFHDLGIILSIIRSSFVDNYASQSSKRIAHMAELLITMSNMLGKSTFATSEKEVFMDLMQSIGGELTKR